MSEITYKAILIGNSIFPNDRHNLQELKGPLNDIGLLFDVLTHPQFGLFNKKDIIQLPNKGYTEINKTLEQFFSDATKDDQLLVYYSGHGCKDINNNFYLCARNTETNAIISTGISDHAINLMIDSSRSRRIIIILDCCHSGLFKGDGVPDALSGKGRFLITSCASTKLSSDSKSKDGYSPFTKHLCNALTSGEVDTNKDGFLSVGEIYSAVYASLKNDTGQQPHRKFDDSVSELAIGRSKRGDPQPTSPSTPLEFWISPTKITKENIFENEDITDEVVEVGGGGIDLQWNVDNDADWIEIKKQKKYFKLKFHPKKGKNRANIFVEDEKTGKVKKLEVFISVIEKKPPILKLSSDIVDLPKISYGQQPELYTLRLFNEGSGSLEPITITTPRWLNLKRKGELVEIIPSIKKGGKYSGEIKIQSAGGNKDVPIQLEIESGPVLEVKPAKLNFGNVPDDEMVADVISVSNKGSGNLKWDFAKSGDFFTVTKIEDTNELEIEIDGSPGKHVGSVIITSNGGSKTVNISANILQMQANGITPGNWVVTINVYNMASTDMYLNLMPNGSLLGQQTVMGFTGQLSGQWFYNTNTRFLTLNMIATLGMFSNGETLQIQITSGSGNLFYGQDTLMRQYIFRKN